MLSRGLNIRYDGTRAAISEQLQFNATLSRKMNSTHDGSSSDESDDEEELNDGSDQDTPSKLIAKAREKTLKTVEDDEVPNSGLLSLPFMVILALLSQNIFDSFTLVFLHSLDSV